MVSYDAVSYAKVTKLRHHESDLQESPTSEERHD